MLRVCCSKKYEIEQMQGEKVVSRSRGFTVDTCVSGKTASEESPMFNGMSTGAKVGGALSICLCQQPHRVLDRSVAWTRAPLLCSRVKHVGGSCNACQVALTASAGCGHCVRLVGAPTPAHPMVSCVAG